MKKKVLLTTVGVSLLSLGLTTANLNHDVHAAKITAGKTAKVTHAAYIYNSKGKRVKKSTLKKNKTTKVIKIIKIKGKNYAQIGKNQFVKLSNLTSTSTKSTKSKPSKKKLNKKTKNRGSKKLTEDELADLGWDLESEGYPSEIELAWIKKYPCLNYDGFKITAKKDTTLDVEEVFGGGSAASEMGSNTGKVKFPKGTSIYWDNTDVYGRLTVLGDSKKLYYCSYGLEVGENKKIDWYDPLFSDDGIMVSVNRDDVTISKWDDITGVDSDEETGKSLDMVVPQANAYKHLELPRKENYFPYATLWDKLEEDHLLLNADVK